MDDTPPSENPPTDFNKIDLAQLQGFSFGTQWSQDKTSPNDRRERDDRPRRDGPAGGEKRDRRAFKRPLGSPADAPAGGAPAPREFQGERPRSPQGGFQGRGGPREGAGGYRGQGGGGPGRGPGGGNFERGPRFGGEREQQVDRGPYDSPFFNSVFYPEDTSFNALVKTIRSSARTIELFEIARTVVGKADRFVVVISRKTAAAGETPGPISISVPDSLPFESDDAAIAYVLQKHMGQFFDTTEAEVEAPKGNFQVVNKCGITGELLGPPNYHRYQQIVQQHFNTKISRMTLDQYRTRIESVRDPEAIAQWLEKMKKVTRYTSKLPVAEGQPAQTFDSFEDARVFLMTTARDKLVRNAESCRFHGKALETMPQGEIRRAVEGALERQRRFPLDTANTLRGRLRREHFTIFKKGSKGISYVCAVKRKFRVPGQVFSTTINDLIGFIEANALVKASELAKRFLTIEAPAEGQTLTVEQREKIARMNGDLVWLVREGYVTEFIDGGLYAPPPMVEARKKEVEASEHDPESFPEAPAQPSAPQASNESASEAAPVEEAAPVQEAVPVEESAPVSEVAPEPAAAPESAPASEPAPATEATPSSESAPGA